MYTGRFSGIRQGLFVTFIIKPLSSSLELVRDLGKMRYSLSSMNLPNASKDAVLQAQPHSVLERALSPVQSVTFLFLN